MGLQKIVAISEFGVITRGDKTREHCTTNLSPLKRGHLSDKATFSLQKRSP
jgi:hypothetical protein